VQQLGLSTGRTVHTTVPTAPRLSPSQTPGKRLINRTHEAQEAVLDPLQVPLYVVEDLVRLRIHQVGAAAALPVAE